VLKHLITSFLFFGFAVTSMAQQTQLFRNPIQFYRLGIEYFDKEKFSAAQKEFENAQEAAEYPNSEITVNSEYMASLCAIQLFHRDGSMRLRDFIRNHPESPKVKDAHFQLGIYHYRKREYQDVIEWFGKVDPYDLTKEEKYEYYFKYGYANLRKKNNENASRAFFEIKDINNDYSTPAKYYFAHISYLDGKYETALKEFQKLENHEKFGPIVPYYITQIYYNQKKYEELLEYAPPLYEKVIEKRKPEVARLIGEAHYYKKDYKSALPFLETYEKESRILNNDDRYQLAYTYYKTEDYNNASKLFSRLSSLKDTMAQLSAYHLADCFMKTNQNVYARSAYKTAYELGFDKKIEEDAMFNYAQLSYELSLNPYQKSIEVFKNYIDKYPNSERIDEAYQYLLAVYLTTKNFDAALTSIDNIENKTPKLKEAYQKISFNKATTLYSERNYSGAMSYYDKSLRYRLDMKLAANAIYWRAEANYRLRNYDEAIMGYKSFIFQPSAILTPHFNEANYNIGYAYFKLEKYADATTWFRKFNYSTKGIDSLKMNDAFLRIGDCFYVLKQYDQAINFYDKAEILNQFESDYALFQKSVCLGIVKDFGGKIASLEKLVTNNPRSTYIDAAYYELGRTYNIQGDDVKALERFNSVIASNANNIYLKKSLISSGLIHYNNGKDNKAIGVFTRIVKDYPTYKDTKEALIVLKSIYIERGQVDEYTNLVAGLSFVDISRSDLDSSVFDAARTRYFEGKCLEAIGSLNNYLDKFKPAIFSVKANYYLADCAEKELPVDSSLVYFEKLAQLPPNEYSELALSKLSKSYYDKEEFSISLSYYMDLELAATSGRSLKTAIEGQLDCVSELDTNALGALLGENYIAQGFSELRYLALAKMFRARVFLEAGKSEEALSLLNFVKDTVATEIGAEAKYSIAKINFDKDSLNDAESQVFELISQIPSYGYWVAKSLILLSDIYLVREDYFQAKATLNSIIENYDGEDLRQVAQDKIEEIDAIENPKQEEPKAPEMEIELDEFNIDHDEIEKLFIDEEEELEDE
jgi:TolA-binding protein